MIKRDFHSLNTQCKLGQCHLVDLLVSPKWVEEEFSILFTSNWPRLTIVSGNLDSFGQVEKVYVRMYTLGCLRHAQLLKWMEGKQKFNGNKGKMDK